MKNHVLALLALLGSTANATVFHEVEPNNTPATANNFTLGDPDAIQGECHTDDKDYFNITTEPAAFGLYKNTVDPLNVFNLADLFIEGAGVGQGIATWYSFGSGSPVQINLDYNSIVGSINYTLAYSRAAITPTNLGTFQQGNFRFQEHNTGVDFGTLDLQIFDSQGRIVPDAWDQNPDRIVFFDFSANLAPGIYYALAGASIRSTVTNTPNAVLGEGNVMATNVIGAQSVNTATIQITTPTSSVSLTDVGHRLSTGPEYIVPYTFTVVPEPTSLLALGAGLAMLGRKRWRR